jgi:hypothetical protein
MPRWLFLISAAAIVLSVLGSAMIVLRSPNGTPQLGGNFLTPAAPGMKPRPSGNS